MSVLGFEVEWYDAAASITRKLYLKYFLEDHTIELLDGAKKATFLKRIYYPSVTAEDLYIGASVTIFNRVIVIKDYANSGTKKYMEQRETHVVACIEAEYSDKLPAVIELARQCGYYLGKIRTTTNEATRQPESVLIEFVGVGGQDEGALLKGLSEDYAHVSAYPASVSDIEAQFRQYYPLDIPENSSLCLVKPHILKDGRIGEVLQSIFHAGFTTYAYHSVHLSLQMAEEIMDAYKTVYPSYSKMMDHLCSGPVVAIIILGSENVVKEFREFCGPIEPLVACTLRAESLRATYGEDVVKNAVHCTDLPEDGILETSYFFETIAKLEK